MSRLKYVSDAPAAAQVLIMSELEVSNARVNTEMTPTLRTCNRESKKHVLNSCIAQLDGQHCGRPR